MRDFGLIGYPLSHSFSPTWFKNYFEINRIYDAQYRLFPLENIHQISDLLINHVHLYGLNVTIPYKQQVIPFLDELSEEARAVGAVNCIKIKRENKEIYLIGHNTDCTGFEQSLKPHLRNHHTNSLIFGEGGASKAVQFVLKKLGISYQIVSRKGVLNYENLTAAAAKESTLWIQTTPVGMYPHTEDCLTLPFHVLTEQHLTYDLVYNPTETQFIKNSLAQGAQTLNGLKMLHLQAAAAATFWEL